MLRGRESSTAETELAAHLVACPACRARLDELAGGSGWLAARAKAHAVAPLPASDYLQAAMKLLESRSDAATAEAAPQSGLDFLLPSDHPGVLGRFGPYEVLAQVAIGGMGIVLKARDPRLNRVVALKILPPLFAANSLARARFVREARAAAAVVHEHVVPIYAVDEFAGLPYLVMQFIVGRPLSERLRATGPLRLEEILRIGAQTASGLAAAHAQGLIHRDVKPGNILLENSVERVKITDFGLARAVDDSSLTHDGHIAGTPEYMAPEQARNEPVDQRADLFSFGCVLYEMATGVSPFRAEKPLASLRRVCDEEPPLAHALNPKVPEWLSRLIQNLLAKHAASRPQSAAQLATELGQHLAELQQNADAPGSTAAAPRRKPDLGGRGSRAVLVPGLILTILVLLAVLYSIWPESSPVPRQPARAASVPKAPAVVPSQAPALFVLTAPDGAQERGFARLAEAVHAAPAGAVIECRFNGLQEIGTVRPIDKALILRAAPGFEPVLTPAIWGDTLLVTRAPLVLEGLTFVTRPQRAAGPSEPPRGAAISIEGAPFLAAHSRFEIPINANPTDRRQPHSIRLLNVPMARLLNCEILSRTGFSLEWRWRPDSDAQEESSHLQLHGCTVEGNLMTPGRLGAGAMKLELLQNTLAGYTLLLLIELAPRLPVQVNASRNVFDVDSLFRSRLFRSESGLKELLRWNGGSNVYSVASFAQGGPEAIRTEQWLASAATEEPASVSTDLGIKRRLEGIAERTRAAEAAAFALTDEERQRLAALGDRSLAEVGADAARNGPGVSHDQWRASPAHREWLELISKHVPMPAASK